MINMLRALMETVDNIQEQIMKQGDKSAKKAFQTILEVKIM